MAEPAAASEVVSMDTDSNAADTDAQRGRCGNVSDVDAAADIVEMSTEDKENDGVQDAARGVEDAASKVSNAPRISLDTRHTQHFGQPDSTCAHLSGPSCGHVCRCQSIGWC